MGGRIGVVEGHEHGQVDAVRHLHVSFIVSGLGVGGAERQLVLLASGLNGRGHGVEILATGEGENLSLARELGLTVEVVRRRGLFAGLRRRLGVLSAIRKSRPDIVHPYLTVNNAWITASKRFIGGAKLVWGVRDSGIDVGSYGRKARFVVWLAERVSHRADLIVVNSEAARSTYSARKYPANRIVVVPNGIDVDLFRPSESHRARLRSAWGVAPDTQVVGMLARFDPMKGHEDFIDAASRLVRMTSTSLVFVVAGDFLDSDRRFLETSLADAGVEGLVLPLQRASEFMNAVDVLVVPSRFGEGFPNVIGEALACGRIVVATDVGDSRSLVEGHGHVVPPCRPDLLAEAIRAAVSHPDDSLIAKRRQFIVENYSVDRLVSRTEELLLGLVSASSRTHCRKGPGP